MLQAIPSKGHTPTNVRNSGEAVYQQERAVVLQNGLRIPVFRS